MFRRFILFLFLFPPCCFCSGQEAVLLNIPLPVSGKAAHSVTQTLDRIGGGGTCSAVILQFQLGENEETYGRGSSFGACYEIANLLTSEKFHGIKTVAFFPGGSYKGHCLLAALACDERIAAAGVELGEAATDEPELTETLRNAYREIVQKRKQIPFAIVEKLLDAKINLQSVETEKGTRYGTPEELEELRKTETFAAEPTEFIAAGQPGLFTAETARKIGLITLLAEDKAALARSLGFRPDDITYAPVAGEHGHAVRIDLTGRVTSDSAGAVIRSLQKTLKDDTSTANKNVDFICLYIDSPGGSLDASLNLASFIVRDIDHSQTRVVAYIPYQARSDAAIAALACDEIVLGSEAVLGGDGATVFTPEEITEAKRMLCDFLAEESLRSWSLPAAFIDPDIEVYEYTRKQNGKDITEYFCDDEFNEQPDVERWTKGKIVKPKGKLLEIVNGKGQQLFIDRTAKNFGEFKLLYGLENDPEFVQPSWADQLVRSLSGPGMSALLLMIFFIALMTEAQTPGLGIGSFVALVAIVLFFWLNFLGGTAGVLEILLFVIGGGCVMLEIFVLPGIGIFGVGGAAAMICSLVLASQTFIIPRNSYQMTQFQNSLLILSIAFAGMFACGFALTRIIHKANKPKDTDTALIQQTEKLADYDSLLGQTGETLTPLVPAGKAMFNGEPADVVSDGELIEKGISVEVAEVIGYKIVVRKKR
ncbi:MAG: hypothetical protein LBN39_07940 [Planctomycetaceae bacterium]|nr:hypothetical protein [Planctomycetaceae bacterium]